MGMDGDKAPASVEVFGYLARPRREADQGEAPDPAVAVLHGADGLTAYHREVARRLAKDGYVALAADLLSRDGGTDAVAPNTRGAALAWAAGAGHLAADCAGAVAHLGRLPGVGRPAAYRRRRLWPGWEGGVGRGPGGHDPSSGGVWRAAAAP